MFECDGVRSFFVADFFCAEKKLVVEVDGGIHEFQQSRDQERDSILGKKGFRVLRIKNEELSNLDEVERKIMHALFQSHEGPGLMSDEERLKNNGE